jgi:hypothetical protein
MHQNPSQQQQTNRIEIYFLAMNLLHRKNTGNKFSRKNAHIAEKFILDNNRQG